MTRFRSMITVAVCLMASAPALADTVDFNSLPTGNTFNPLTINGATFFTNNGFNYIASVGTNALCPSITSANPADCSRTLEVLLGQQASDLSFGFVANNTQTIGADVGDVAIFSGPFGSNLLGIVNMIVTDNGGFTLDTVALTGFSGVTRLVITPDDFGGLLYDDFSFQLAVPEPATWAMMIAGFGLAGIALRKRAATPVPA